MIRKINNFYLGFIVLGLISIMPLMGLMHSGMPVTHDGQDHVARIANFYQSLSEGNLIPRWASKLNWGYGHPILMFLYPFPSYIAVFFHILGFSFVDATKLVFAITYTASILCMYMWVGRKFGILTGIITALIYGFSPYRFVDLYVRGALGEHVAFIFPPLILLSLDYIKLTLNNRNKPVYSTILLAFSVGLLILSHNALAIMFLPIAFFYFIYLLLFESKSQKLFGLFSSIGVVFGFTLSAFFWIPAFFEGKYTLRDIVSGTDIFTRFVPFKFFIYSPWNYGGGNDFSKEIGYFVLLAVVICLVQIFSNQSKQMRVFLISNFIIFITSLFLMTDWSKTIWQHISIIQKFQFPWRLMSVTVFSASLLGGIGVSQLILKFIKIHKNI